MENPRWRTWRPSWMLVFVTMETGVNKVMINTMQINIWVKH